MPEATDDAAILIATSWQALNRAENGDERTMICNCTIVIVFACFFIEANLNHIIDIMNKTEDMKQFLHKRDPGLQGKLAWFYNCYDRVPKTCDKKKLYEELRTRFPGFNEINQFRNDISHGKIVRSNLDNAESLRKKAKAIVDELFKIAEQADCKISRPITYETAITSCD